MPKPNLPNSLVLLVLLIVSAVTANAQVGIGTNTPATSAQLEVSSTSKGFLPPRMTEAQKNAISNPVDGLVLFQTDGTVGLYLRKAGAWMVLDKGVDGLTGPAGPTGATGPQGTAGAQGIQGAIGLTGQTGSTGLAGPQGIKGDTGLQGLTGPAGSTGSTGLTGSQGLKGEIGVTGSTGVAGPSGLTGSQGIKGDTGAAGTDAVHTGEVTGSTSLTIASNAVTTAKIAAGAVTDAKITDVAASKITGTLSVLKGGTGATTLSTNYVLLGNGTNPLQTVAPGTNGNVLTSNGSTWTSAAGSSGTTAAGALTGNTLAVNVLNSSLTSVGTIANLTTGAITNSGKVIVGASSAASASAVLEASSTTQGFLPPRMTVAQKSAITTPAQGLIIYCTDCGANGEPEYFNGSTWLNMAGNAAAKAIPTVNISMGTYTYSGAVQGPNAATNTGTGTVYTYSYVGTGSTTYVSSATRPIIAGTYNVTATVGASVDGNYAAASSTATAFTITKAAPTVTPVIGTYSYNLASPVAQGPSAATNTGTGSAYTYSYSGTGFTTYGPTATKPTDGGTYTVTSTVGASSDGNYAAASSNATAFRISTTLSIGNSFGGGKVAYILQSGDSGYDAAQQHGLIISGDLTASFTDIIWGIKDVVTGAIGGGENVDSNNHQSVDLGSGINNTNIIIASEGAGTNYAAGLARAYRGGGYTNWYLPSYGEWAAMQYWRASFTFNRGAYWTSTEYLDIWAYRWIRGSGMGVADKNFANAGVCAVRCF